MYLTGIQSIGLKSGIIIFARVLEDYSGVKSKLLPSYQIKEARLVLKFLLHYLFQRTVSCIAEYRYRLYVLHYARIR